MKNLSLEQLKAKQKTLQFQNASIGLLGGIGGVAYSNKTNGGFWRGVGYFILGSFIVGFLPRILYFIDELNEVEALINEKEKNKKI